MNFQQKFWWATQSEGQHFRQEFQMACCINGQMEGYEGLVAQRKGGPPKEFEMKKNVIPPELTPSEREEMIRLRAENE